MTYVLILTPDATRGWPAVIGGYPSREEATAAGREATMRDITDALGGRDFWDAPEVGVTFGHPYLKRPWIDFTVIPGAAQ